MCYHKNIGPLAVVISEEVLEIIGMFTEKDVVLEQKWLMSTTCLLLDAAQSDVSIVKEIARVEVVSYANFTGCTSRSGIQICRVEGRPH